MLHKLLEKSFWIPDLMRQVKKKDLSELIALAERKCGSDWWAKDVVKTYLKGRAADIAIYGDKVADQTFPQPVRKHVDRDRVSRVVARMARALQEARREQERQKDEREDARKKNGRGS